MDFEIFLTNPAVADLEAVLEWSVRNHPDTTATYFDDLLDRLNQLRTFPYSGRPVGTRARTRILYHTPFRIYYQVKPRLRRVDILHVWHGRRRGPFGLNR